MIIIPIISLIISILLITVLFIDFRNRQKKFNKTVRDLYNLIHNDINIRLCTCEAAGRDHEDRLKKVETFEDYKELFRPYIQTWQHPCYLDDGICTNPHHDCVNCPRLYGNTGNSGKYKQYWTSDSTSASVNNFDSSNVTVTDENINKEFVTPTNE